MKKIFEINTEIYNENFLLRAIEDFSNIAKIEFVE